MLGFGRKDKAGKKYSGRPLSAEAINARQQSNDHIRRERQKNFEHIAILVAIAGAMVAIPVLYAILLLINRHSPDKENTYIWSGITAAVGFVFGKKSGSKNE